MFEIPVNPGYAPQVPDVQTQYVNPVTLNNVLITLANEVGNATADLAVASRQEASVKARLKRVEARLSQLERELLLQFPPSSTQSKSNKMLDAYLDMIALESGKQTLLDECREQLRLGQAELLRVQAEKDVQEGILAHLKIASDNIRSHLSYIKVDMQQRQGP